VDACWSAQFSDALALARSSGRAQSLGSCRAWCWQRQGEPGRERAHSGQRLLLELVRLLLLHVDDLQLEDLFGRLGELPQHVAVVPRVLVVEQRVRGAGEQPSVRRDAPAGCSAVDARR
jgi:hypothetical protein